MFGLGAAEGTGKTRTALDLHRRVWNREKWPDGQEPTLEPGRPAIWLCSDGHQDELAEILTAFGLPDESVVFPATPEEPYEGTDLDAPGLIDQGGVLERAIAAVRPWCVFIDTLTYATSRNLCDQHVMKDLKAPLVRLAQTYGVNFGLSLHLSREGQALGRRIKGLTRTLIHLECPDPENQPHRLKFWVEKTFDKKPPPLGLTLGTEGNEYDFNPPVKPTSGDPNGRPPAAREKACKFILDALAGGKYRKATELCNEFVSEGGNKNTFWDARDHLTAAREIICDGRPLIMRLPLTDDDNPVF